MKKKRTKSKLQNREDKIARNLAESAGGADIPDPSDVPGGINQTYNNLNDDPTEAWDRKENDRTGIPPREEDR